MIKLFQFAFNRKFAGNRGAAKTVSFIGYDSSGRAIDLNEVPTEYVVRVLKMNGIIPDEVTADER